MRMGTGMCLSLRMASLSRSAYRDGRTATCPLMIGADEQRYLIKVISSSLRSATWHTAQEDITEEEIRL